MFWIDFNSLKDVELINNHKIISTSIKLYSLSYSNAKMSVKFNINYFALTNEIEDSIQIKSFYVSFPSLVIGYLMIYWITSRVWSL
jgi:hypothetical protein